MLSLNAYSKQVPISIKHDNSMQVELYTIDGKIEKISAFVLHPYRTNFWSSVFNWLWERFWGKTAVLVKVEGESSHLYLRVDDLSKVLNIPSREIQKCAVGEDITDFLVFNQVKSTANKIQKLITSLGVKMNQGEETLTELIRRFGYRNILKVIDHEHFKLEPMVLTLLDVSRQLAHYQPVEKNELLKEHYQSEITKETIYIWKMEGERKTKIDLRTLKVEILDPVKKITVQNSLIPQGVDWNQNEEKSINEFISRFGYKNILAYIQHKDPQYQPSDATSASLQAKIDQLTTEKNALEIKCKISVESNETTSALNEATRASLQVKIDQLTAERDNAKNVAESLKNKHGQLVEASHTTLKKLKEQIDQLIAGKKSIINPLTPEKDQLEAERRQLIEASDATIGQLQKQIDQLTTDRNSVVNALNPLKDQLETERKIGNAILDLRKISAYGKLLGGAITSANYRSLIVPKVKLDANGNQEILPEDILTNIAQMLFETALFDDNLENARVARTSLKNFEGVSRRWWKACTNLIASHEKNSLPKLIQTKAPLFPKDISKMIMGCIDRKQTFGTFYLDSNILSPLKPSKDATEDILLTFPGLMVPYKTERPKKYPYNEVSYFKHPDYSWATVLIDFITWPMIENFSLLFIEGCKGIALAMPYTYEISESKATGKGVIIIQRMVDKAGKEQWFLIDKPLDIGCQKARVFCILSEYNQFTDEGLLDINHDEVSAGFYSKKYLEWLNNFLAGNTCPDLPFRVQDKIIIDKENSDEVNRTIRHYNP